MQETDIQARKSRFMRTAGMIATFTTLVAIVVALLSLTNMGFSLWELFLLLWPVALTVGVFVGGVMLLGYGSLKLLPKDRGAEPGTGHSAGGHDGQPKASTAGKHT